MLSNIQATNRLGYTVRYNNGVLSVLLVYPRLKIYSMKSYV